MKVEFLKDHPIGIAQGTVREVSEKFGKRMIEQEFAAETDKSITASPKKGKEAAGAKLQKIAEKQAASKKQAASNSGTEALKALYESKKPLIEEEDQLKFEIILESGNDKELKSLEKKLNKL